MNTVISSVNISERANLGIKSGDTVRVWVKIEEKDKTRLQAFEGLVLAVKHGSEAGGAFTVRRTSGGFGMEKIFPLYSPMIDKIEIVKRAKVRRSKLYHIRDKAAKEIRRQMRNINLVALSTSSDIDEKNKVEQVKVDEEKAEAEKIEKEKLEPEAKTVKETKIEDKPSEVKAESPKTDAPKEDIEPEAQPKELNSKTE
jgi:large subunit ribosomal protein L19